MGFLMTQQMAGMRSIPRRFPLLWVLLLATAACEREAPVTAPATAAEAAYVGGAACVECHQEEAASWAGSHHDLAMQVADTETVLGDFSGTSFTHNGITSEFSRRDGAYRLRSDDADGRMAEFAVTHTFGVEPLQQYLIEMQRGRYQATTIAWDSHPPEAGGQRWFHVYGEASVDSNDPLHWTGVFQNWNANCAFCHSTNLLKNYDPATDSYATSWSSIDVDCEACHGPGSLHVAAPERAPLQLAADKVNWVFAPGETVAHRQPAKVAVNELDTCARCHARRGQLVDAIAPGAPFLDGFRPAFLEAGLYHADGQILDEVYVWGSFVQSRMHAAGVTCSDCHDAHSAQLKAPGDAVCAQCHLMGTYAAESHHRHQPDTDGARCVNCHMPARNYMVVDPRRDHSMRVPRPDLSVELGVPNACTGCHGDRDDAWAAAAVKAWYPEGRSGTPHYAQALHAGRNWSSDRAVQLRALADDTAAPGIVRGTAILLLAEQPDAAAVAAITRALRDDSALLRLAALQALAALPIDVRADLSIALLGEPLLALRLTAVEQLLPVRDQLRQQQRELFDRALSEYRQSLAFNSDRAEGLLQQASLHSQFDEPGRAEALLQSAIARQPWMVAASVNLADLYRGSSRDAEALDLLERAVAANPEDPAGHFGLGLALVRAGQSDIALDKFRRAATLAPDAPYYRYIEGVALHSTGRVEQALASLTTAHDRFPGHRDITFALSTMHRDAGNREQALRYARELFAQSPDDTAALALINELQATE